MENADWSAYLFMLVLLGLSAFFSASETAYSTANQMRLRAYAEAGNQKAAIALKIAENFDKTLYTVLVGNNIVNLSLSSLATVVATQIFGNAGAAIATGIITILVLTFGEVMPKSMAKDNAESLAIAVARPMRLMIILLTPVSWIFRQLKEITSRRGKDGRQPSMTEQELKYMVETIEEEGVLEEEESDLVQSALEFDDITAEEILTPRVDMVALDIGDPPEENLKIALDCHYSRLPVYRDNTDNIIGVVHKMDLLENRVEQGGRTLGEMMTPCMFVHRTLKMPDLLAKFQRSKSHLAIVTDDYGGTLGVVTLEDVLEQLVGDIWDESDEVVHDFAQVGENDYEISADLSISDFFEKIEYEPKGFESDFNTMGGWALEMLERIPQEGDSYRYDRFTVTVTQVEDQRIIKLRVHLDPEPAPEAKEKSGRKDKEKDKDKDKDKE